MTRCPMGNCGNTVFFDKCDECDIFREAVARITNHTGSHDHVGKGVISKTPSDFSTFASEKGTANEQESQIEEELVENDVLKVPCIRSHATFVP